MFLLPNQVNDPLQQVLNREVQQRTDCLMCYGAHHGEYCRRLWERCFECHVPAQSKTDHAANCSINNWLRSEKYVDMYVKTSAVRVTISSANPFSYLCYGEFVYAQAGMELFSGMADVHFKFVSPTQLELKTSGFTRIRLPVVIEEKNGQAITLTERIVFMTSHDRTIVAAKSSRIVNRSSVTTGLEHNTPLVLRLERTCARLHVNIHSGGRIHHYAVEVDGKKFKVPEELNVTSNNFTQKLFDADVAIKKFKRN